MLNERPTLSLKRSLEAPVPERPLSAFELNYRGLTNNGMLDVEMSDAGPSTAPLRPTGPNVSIFGGSNEI